jgi:hypothetical protein
MKHNLFLKKKKRTCPHRRIFLFQEQMVEQRLATGWAKQPAEQRAWERP